MFFRPQSNLTGRKYPKPLSSQPVAGLLSIGLLCSLFPSFAEGQSSDTQLPDSPGQRYTSQASAQNQASEEAPTVRGLPTRFLKDEVAIVTSPARIRTDDLKWLLPLAGATGVALGTDSYTMRNVVSRNRSFNNAAATSSDVLLGSALGVPVLLFGIGHMRSDEHQRETGLLASEAILDAYVFDTAVKYTTLRERPSQNDARGHFFVGDASSSPSFVSGHCIMAWSSAAVLAAEYNKPWQQAGIYTLASGVSLTRVLAQQHFPTDALLGSAAGWLIGHYVYRAHNRFRSVRLLGQKP